MEKLYRKTADTLRYHEVWAAGGVVTEHWGKVGEKGETREHELKAGVSEEDQFRAILQKAVADGFEPIDIDDHITLIVEYDIDDFGTSSDLDKRHALQERLDETLGWTGLGHVDGGSIGSGTMEVCCYVVDFQIAQDVIARDLADTEFGNFSRIFDEDAEA